jgi:hypothetical protein
MSGMFSTSFIIRLALFYCSGTHLGAGDSFRSFWAFAHSKTDQYLLSTAKNDRCGTFIGYQIFAERLGCNHALAGVCFVLKFRLGWFVIAAQLSYIDVGINNIFEHWNLSYSSMFL